MKTILVDAFTGDHFLGNRAAVCPLSNWVPDHQLQRIAFDYNYSETVFVVPEGDQFHIRWFTPLEEVPLCGHGTLAAAAVIMQSNLTQVVFKSLSGPIHAKKLDDQIQITFPQFTDLSPTSSYPSLFDRTPLQVFNVGDFALMAQFSCEDEIRNYQPKLEIIRSLKKDLIITARADSVDFVSRCFCPHQGIDEDPVTGSTHCFLAPFWAPILGKEAMRAWQLSKNGGELFVKLKNNGVLEISGQVKII